MAKPTVADYLLERLRAWDVTEVFAYPDDENRRSVIMEGIKTKVQEFLPHSRG